jgi:hypothetical protein
MLIVRQFRFLEFPNQSVKLYLKTVEKLALEYPKPVLKSNSLNRVVTLSPVGFHNPGGDCY